MLTLDSPLLPLSLLCVGSGPYTVTSKEKIYFKILEKIYHSMLLLTNIFVYLLKKNLMGFTALKSNENK